MKYWDVLREAVSNTSRNKTRTSLTVIAVFIGAFTLALTNSIGAGVSTYISGQLEQIGNENVMTVSKPADVEETTTGPKAYDETTAGQPGQQLPPGAAASIQFLTEDDIKFIETIPNIEKVEPSIFIQPDYIEGANGDKWQVTADVASSVSTPDLASGEPFSNDGNYEVIIPLSYVEPLGYTSNEAAVGEQVTVGVTDFTGEQHIVTATVTGVNNTSLFGESVGFNSAVTEEIYSLSNQGLPESTTGDTYLAATIFMAPDLTITEIEEIKQTLTDESLQGLTLNDQLGAIQAVINGIVGILNGFAVIALFAAGFGIINTLLMSVQERTREIGLMKAMGMSSSKIYALFSTEAVLIGLFGTLLGVGFAFLTGMGINAILAGTLLADLPGLTISLFTFPNVATVVILVGVISFLAGTIPASRAAKQNPIDALRYE